MDNFEYPDDEEADLSNHYKGVDSQGEPGYEWDDEELWLDESEAEADALTQAFEVVNVANWDD